MTQFENNYDLKERTAKFSEKLIAKAVNITNSSGSNVNHQKTVLSDGFLVTVVGKPTNASPTELAEAYQKNLDLSRTKNAPVVEHIIHFVHSVKIPLLQLLSNLGVDWRQQKTVL